MGTAWRSHPWTLFEAIGQTLHQSVAKYSFHQGNDTVPSHPQSPASLKQPMNVSTVTHKLP